MIPGENWFPVTGHIILKGNKPIASVPEDKIAYEIMEALTECNKGVTYTCISNKGWFCKEKLAQETPTEGSQHEGPREEY